MPLQLDTMAPLSPGSPETWLVDTPSGAVLGVVFADGKRRSLLMREPLPRKRIAEPPSFGAWKEGAEWSEASGTRYVGFSGGLAWLQDFYSGDVTAVAADGTTHRIRNR